MRLLLSSERMLPKRCWNGIQQLILYCAFIPSQYKEHEKIEKITFHYIDVRFWEENFVLINLVASNFYINFTNCLLHISVSIVVVSGQQGCEAGAEPGARLEVQERSARALFWPVPTLRGTAREHFLNLFWKVACLRKLGKIMHA